MLINLELTQGFQIRMWQQTHYIVVYVQLGLFKSKQGCNYRKISNIGAPNPKLKCSSSRHAFVFAQYTEAKCLNGEWKCSSSSADRRCSNYI